MAAGIPSVAAVLREEDSAGGCKMLGILLAAALLLVSALSPGCNCCCLLDLASECCAVWLYTRWARAGVCFDASGALGMQCVPKGFRKWLSK